MKRREAGIIKKWTLKRKKKKDHKPEAFGPITVNETKEQLGQASPEKGKMFRFEPNPKYHTICIYALITLIISVVIIELITHLPEIKSVIGEFLTILRPFIIAFFIAFIMNPIVKALSDRFFGNVCKIKNPKVRLSLAILTAYLVTISLLVGFFFGVIPQIANSVEELAGKVPDAYNQIIHFLNTIEERWPDLDVAWVEEKLNEWLPQIMNYGKDIVTNVIPMILNISISIVKIAIEILLAIAISIYMLYDKRSLTKNATRILYAFTPRKQAEVFRGIMRECSNIFTGFIVGKAIDSTIIGILCFIIMTIIGLPYAVLLSVIVGITNMIPYFGPFIGGVPGVLLYLCINPLEAVVFAIMILILQQFDGWILGPKILGDSTGLTPLWVIFGITVGGAYGGVLGMFLGVPVVAVLAYLVNLIISHFLKKKRLEVM